MSRGAIFPNDPSGRAEFKTALMRWVQEYEEKGTSRDMFFGKHYGMGDTAVRNTSKRLGIPIPTPQGMRVSHSKETRRAIVIEQRKTGKPPQLIAKQLGIRYQTFRQWAWLEKLPFAKNTQLGRRQWWAKQFPSREPMHALTLAFGQELPLDDTIQAFIDLYKPAEHLMWVITPEDYYVEKLSESQWLDTVASSEPCVSIDDANAVLTAPGESRLLYLHLASLVKEDTSGDQPLEMEGRVPIPAKTLAVWVPQGDVSKFTRCVFKRRYPNGLVSIQPEGYRTTRTVPATDVYDQDDPQLADLIQRYQGSLPSSRAERARHKQTSLPPSTVSPFDEEAQ